MYFARLLCKLGQHTVVAIKSSKSLMFCEVSVFFELSKQREQLSHQIHNTPVSSMVAQSRCPADVRSPSIPSFGVCCAEELGLLRVGNADH